MAANYNVIITKILITRVNSRFRTINFIFNTVLRLDDLALFDSALQLLIIFLFSHKFIREINIIYRYKYSLASFIIKFYLKLFYYKIVLYYIKIHLCYTKDGNLICDLILKKNSNV